MQKGENPRVFVYSNFEGVLVTELSIIRPRMDFNIDNLVSALHELRNSLDSVDSTLDKLIKAKVSENSLVRGFRN